MAFFSGIKHICCVFIILSWINLNYGSSANLNFACPKRGPTVEYKGSEIYLSQVKACASVNQQASVIVIKSFKSVYIDTDFTSLQNSAIHPSILLITPTLFVNGKRNIYLNGGPGASPPTKPYGKGTTKGIPGAPGGTAGSFIIAYQNRAANGIGDISFQLVGGNGGGGQAGQDAISGANGVSKTMRERDESYCSAWSGGWVKVWITPNKCHESMDSQRRCKANNSGARWEVYGTDGKVGVTGNDGGAAGVGGNGGLGIVADIMKSVNKTYSGTSGKVGYGGQPGAGGKGGKQGNKLHVTIDDANGSKGKWCKFVRGPSYESVNVYARDGAPGRVGVNRDGAKQPLPPFTLNQFRPHIQSYFNDCAEAASQSQDFNLLKFCVQVKSYFRL